MDKVEDTLD
ncbi:unnamed protein product [Leptidea sinapis]|uniref:Uncharacterized protein n=1 Tax=Leptidea sinapis TaxID=189913 RepID=A0A5E4QT08_9NEOP|nr:unnamed protein product [Leptidea sinapis]